MNRKLSLRQRYEYGGFWCILDHWGHTWPFVPKWLENRICWRYEKSLLGGE